MSFPSAFISAAVLPFLCALPLSSCGQQWLHIPDGVTQNAIALGDLDIGGNQITLEALVSWRPSQSTDIVSKHSEPNNVNYLFRVKSMEIRTSQGYALLTAPISLCYDSVYHHAATYDGSFIRYYLNGSLVASMPWSGALHTNNLNAYIGNMQLLMDEQLRGYIDELRIWQVARTEAEIQANMYTLPDPANQPGLLAYYTFEGDYVNMANPGTWDGTPVGSQIGLATNPGFTGQVSNADCLSTGLPGLQPASPLRITPNPAQGILCIELTASAGFNGPVTVLNALGQPLRMSARTVEVFRDGQQSLTLDVSGLPAGAYFVVVPTEEGYLHGRFVKE